MAPVRAPNDPNVTPQPDSKVTPTRPERAALETCKVQEKHQAENFRQNFAFPEEKLKGETRQFALQKPLFKCRTRVGRWEGRGASLPHRPPVGRPPHELATPDKSSWPGPAVLVWGGGVPWDHPCAFRPSLMHPRSALLAKRNGAKGPARVSLKASQACPAKSPAKRSSPPRGGELRFAKPMAGV